MKAPKPKPYQSVLAITAGAAVASWPPTPFIWTAMAASLLVAAYLYRLQNQRTRGQPRLGRKRTHPNKPDTTGG